MRELYETFRNFKVRISDYLRYRKITSNMNDRFPDATPEELNSWVLRLALHLYLLLLFYAFESIFLDMAMQKWRNLHHLSWRDDYCKEASMRSSFHVHCLRSWLERQHTCPTCRALVVPSENGTTATGGQQRPQSDAHRQGNHMINNYYS
jgi:E3 ubiquitin-protein ligase synoviolin